MPERKQPLTVDQLQDIGVRRRGDEDVRALLWEIKGLRDELEVKRQEGFRDTSIISRCYQISRCLPNHGGILGMLFDDLKKQLEGHPVREHQDGIADTLKYPSDVQPGDDD